jgi:threonine/homoserine/homoserine lactone efflux protein
MARAIKLIGFACFWWAGSGAALAQEDKGVTAATEAVEDAEPPKDEQAFFSALTWRSIGPNDAELMKTGAEWLRTGTCL